MSQVLLVMLLGILLLCAPLTMAAVSASCRLFVVSVLPGLFPYLTLVLLLLSNLPQRRPPWLVLILGWCGGSPAGARLLRQCPQLDVAVLRRLAVACATMSPMFLLGTVPAWLQCRAAGWCILAAVLGGGAAASYLANLGLPAHVTPLTRIIVEETHRLSFGEAVEASARTMLLVCGVMAMLRAAAALCGQLLAGWPQLCLLVQTLLEVTCGIQQLAALPVPMAWRVALISGAAGFGGLSLLLQNRAVLPSGLLPLPNQLALQAAHGGCSLLLGLALGLLAGL